MKTYLNKIINTLVITFAIPGAVFAQRASQNTDPAVAQADRTIMLENPLGGAGGINSISEFTGAIIDLVLTVAVPVLVLAFIWLGFQFVLAQGNSTKLEKVKQNLWYTIIGVAIVLGAKALSEAIGAAFKSIT